MSPSAVDHPNVTVHKLRCGQSPNVPTQTETIMQFEAQLNNALDGAPRSPPPRPASSLANALPSTKSR